MSLLKVDTIQTAAGTGSLTVPAETGTVVVKDGSNDVTLNDITAGGIYLGGTGAANYLDDYEEGTWTPGVTTGGGSVTVTGESGTYTKVGRLVHLTCTILFSGVSSPTGAIQITGVPFSSTIANAQGSVYFAASVSKDVRDFLVQINNGTDLRCFIADGNLISSAYANAQQIDASTQIYISITYPATS